MQATYVQATLRCARSLHNSEAWSPTLAPTYIMLHVDANRNGVMALRSQSSTTSYQGCPNQRRRRVLLGASRGVEQPLPSSRQPLTHQQPTTRPTPFRIPLQKQFRSTKETRFHQASSDRLSAADSSLYRRCRATPRPWHSYWRHVATLDLKFLLRGVPFEAMKVLGWWASDAFTLYL